MNDATYMQVGRNCLRDFTGLMNPEQACAMAEVLFSVSDLLSAAEDDGFEGGFGGGQRFTTIATYLPYVACTIRTDGWLSRTAARDMDQSASADIAMAHGVYAKPGDKNRLEPSEADYNLASATIEFVADFFDGCDVQAISDYENSLRVAMASGIVHPKFTGIIASAILFYKRDVERRAKNEVWAKMVANSKHQGTVGERQVFENLKVLSYRTWESQYGVTHFYSFVDVDGNAFTYFASRDMNLAVGQVVSLKGSVKKHEMYTPKFEGAPTYAQTTLTRCALVTRATVVSVEVEEVKEQKLMNPKEAFTTKPGTTWERIEPIYSDVAVKYYHYHLASVDGRKFILTSKSKKKVLVPGYEAVVEYLVEDLSNLNGGERPTSLVK